MNSAKPGRIRVGIGGWTFVPWRKGVFYPEGLAHARELPYAARALTSIEINGTYYSTFKPDNWRKWAAETPDDFVFSVKGSRFVTNRKQLAGAGPSLERFIDQGLTELGAKLGPINWQLAPTKKFDAEDIAAFFSLLPKEHGGLTLRHAIEVRHPSFDCAEFIALARSHSVAVVEAKGSDYPDIRAGTGGFTYVRLMITKDDRPGGITKAQIAEAATLAQERAQVGDAFIYFIAGAKEHNPAAAQALIAQLSAAGGASSPPKPSRPRRAKTR